MPPSVSCAKNWASAWTPSSSPARSGCKNSTFAFDPYTGIENTYLFARADVVPDLSTTAAEWATEGIVEVDTWDTERMRAAAGRALFSPRALPDMLDAVLANALPNPPLSVGL